MAIDTALVTQLTGQAWLRSADGELIPLRQGMRIPVDAQLVTAEGASVHLQIPGMHDIVIGENREFLFTADVVDPQVDPASAAAGPVEDPQFESLVAAIKAGQDPFDAVDPTAAVLTGGSGGGGGSFVRLSRVLETTLPLAASFRSPSGEMADTEFAERGMAEINPASAGTEPGTGNAGEGSGFDSGSGSGSSPDAGSGSGAGNGSGAGPGTDGYGSGQPGTGGSHTPSMPAAPDGEEGEAGEPPRLTVTIHGNTVEFVFDQMPIGFDVNDVQVANGAISNLVQSANDPKVWTAELTLAPDFEGEVTVSVPDGSYTNQAGVPGHGAAASVIVDTLAPEAEIQILSIAGDGTVNGVESRQDDVAIVGTVGKDVKAGDTVTVLIGDHVFTGLVGADKTWTIDVSGSVLVENASLQVRAQVTTRDQAGNAATASTSAGYGVDLSAQAFITIDMIAGDDVLNNDEASVAATTVTGTVGGDAKVGDVVTLTVNGAVFAGQVTVGAGDALVYSIDVATADLLVSRAIEASVTATDAVGNRVTATAGKTLDVDREAEASITIDTVAGDDVLNDDEASTLTTTIAGTAGGDAKAGDTVTLTVNGKAFLGEVVAGTNGALAYSIDVTTADLLASPAIEASITTTDAAGNHATATANKTLAVDREAEASITIDTVAGDDTLNDDESSMLTTAVTGRVGGDVKAGDMITLTVNGAIYTGQVVIDAGDALVYRIDVPTSDLLASPVIEASVTARDAAGNIATAVANKELVVDRQAEASITIDRVAQDDILNDAESSSLTTTVRGTVGGDVKAGDTVTLTVNGNVFNGQAAAGAGGALIYNIDVSTADLLASPVIEASVTATDAAGNRATATANKTLTVDREADASITVDVVAGDDILNNDEASIFATTITGTVGGDVRVGDTVTLTVNGQTFTGNVVVGAGGALAYSVDVATADLLASPIVEASVTATDAAGNRKMATASRTISVDREAQASITIDMVADDDVLNGDEALTITMTITGAVGGDAKVGDTVTLTVNGKTFTGQVMAGAGDALAYGIDVPTSDLLASPVIEASVTATDTAGNRKTATANRTLAIDREADASITIDTVVGDDILNDDESSAPITPITGTVGGDVQVDDTVVLTVNGRTYTGQVVAGLDGSLVYSIDVTTADLLVSPTIKASVTATDAAGNHKTATASKTLDVDREAEASITIDAVAGDDILNDDEASAIETTITGQVGGDAKAGDTVTLTVNGNNFNGLVTAGAGGALVYSIDVSTADLLASPVIEASVTSTDAAGNRKTATASKTISVDREAQASITIDTVAGDDVLNDDESSEPTTTITGTVGGDAKVGDTVMLRVNGKAFTGEVVAGSDGALVYSIDVATSDLLALPAVEASVTATDAAGNRAMAVASKTLAVDRVAEAVIGIDVVAEDDVLNDAESSALSTTVNGTVGGDVKAGDTVTLTVNGKTFTGEVMAGAAGALIYSIDVATSDLLASPSIEASVTATDAAGNRATATADRTLAVDREAQASITIGTIAGDDVLNEEEASAPTIVITGAVGGDVKVGDTVTLTVNGNTYTGQVTVGAGGALTYSIGVATSDVVASPAIEASVTALDAAGNSRTATAVRSVTVDVSAPEANGGTIAVAEDQSVDIGWQDLSVRGDDVDYIVVTQIPAKGLLEYKDQDGAWKVVAAGQTFMPEQVESGLRFTPAENESGPNYAGLGFHAVDKVGNVGETATISIDVTPVADAPDVSLSISEGKAVPGGGSAGDATIIQVNGGSGRPGGFDVQDGKIIRIGDGVRIWLTEGDVVPEIVSSGSSAPAGQIKYYDAHGNPQGDGQYADIFVIHENSSGFYRQSDWPADRKDPRDIQAVHGTSTSNGPNALKDYIFVQGSPAKDGGPGFDATYQTNNNNATHVNTLNGVYVTYKDAQGNVKTLVRSGNQLEGIIFGDGQHTVLADPGDTTLAREESAPGHIEYELQASAVLRDLDGSESLSGITLTGLPEGTILSYGDTTVTIGADGRHLIANPHDYVAHPVAGAGSAGSSFVIGFTIKVPIGSEPFTIRAEATATERGNQQASQGHAEAAVDMSVDAPATDDPTPDTPEPDTPEPDTPTPPDDPSAPEPTGAELLLNGDFKIYANAGDWGPGNPGNIYGGFKYWTASADFMSNAYRMENKPYVGVWKGSGQDISLKQHISGVTAGTVLELDLAWNNPNHGAPAGGYNAGNPDNTGRSVSLEITFGGVVYAMVTTPWASASVADSQFATVTAFNGAQVSIGQIATWYNTYGWRGEDAHPLPPTVEGIFDKLQITLPDDVALNGDLQLRWVPGSETIAKGQDYMDDLMIANVKVLQGVPPEAPPQAFSLLDDVAVEDDDAPDYVYDAPALARLNSILDDDAPAYDEDDASTVFRQSDAAPIESAVAGYGLASEKQSPLELEQLFTDAEHVEGSLEHHLIPDAGEPGSETVLAANRDGTEEAAGNGPRPVILHAGANVDFMAADTQSELIQSMIADGKQKVDQA